MASALTLYQGFQQQFPELVTPGLPGYAETIRTSRISSWLDGATEFFSLSDNTSIRGPTIYSLSDSEISSVASQRTVPGGYAGSDQTPPTSNGSSNGNDNINNGHGQNAAGLDHDAEAKETRKQMLERRRKDCEADEVAVAMAPIYKIKTSYMFYPEQYKRFRTMFPRVTPDPGLSFTHHDHPVAHTATQVGIRHIQQGLTPGKSYLDIYGNPNGNEQFNRFQASRRRKRPSLPPPPRIETMVYPNSSQDMVRMHTKWGEEKDSDGAARYVVDQHGNIPENSFDGFISIHTLYYMTMLEVTQLLHKNKGATIRALVNYSPEQTGTLYGELRFSKANGITTQTSPNGESYRHPDIDQWFQTQTFKYNPEPGNDHGSYGIAWTSRCIGGPLYVIDIAYCPGSLARMTPYEPPQAPTLRVARGAYLAFVRVGHTDVQLRITNHQLASELRHHMVLRDRSNPQTMADLAVKARRMTAPDIVTGSRQYEVSDGELQDHIVYAYLVDAPGELELLEGVKLLRADVLLPHAKSLKLEGDDKVNSILQSIGTWLGVHRAQPVPTISGTRHKHLTKPTANSGGLLAAART